MKKRVLNIGTFLVLILIGVALSSKAQIYAPERNWSDTTRYTKLGVKQDSIFVFFSSSNKLRAQFSDGSKSTYVWKKYDETTYPVSARFKLVAGATDSVLTNIARGGYRVWVTRQSDDSTQVYTCWLMVDEVLLDTINVFNGCDYLELKTITSPTALGINNNNLFSYWDITSPGHTKIPNFSRDYFKNLTWQASSPEVSIPIDASLILTISNPAPLFDSKYSIQIQNPFGRILTSETNILPSRTTVATFKVYAEIDGVWVDESSLSSREAPLKLKLESQAQNADSIYWRIIDAEKFLNNQRDSIVWLDSSLFSDRIESYPTPTKMLPGTYTILHIAEKTISGCRDTMKITVKVDSSKFNVGTIPNVFSPNGDKQNQYFKFILNDSTDISSVKSFKIAILSRQGQLIYEYSGKNPKEWEGWDGKIKGTSKDAPEGIFYYIIEAVGWDGRKFQRGKFRGFLYLYRGK